MGRCCRKSSPHGGCPSPSTIVPYVNFGLLWSKGIGRKKQLSACSLLIYTTWSIPFLQPLGKECSTGTLFLKSPWNHIQGCHPKNAEASNGNTETQRVARPKHPKRSSPAWYFAKIKNHQRSPADKWWQMFMFSSNAARHIPQFSHHSSSATTFCRVWTSNPTETTQLYSTKINLFHAISPSFYDILSPMHSRRRPWFPQNCNLSTYWIDLGSSSFSLEIRTIAIISDWVLRPSWTNQRHQRTKYNRTRYGLRVWVYLRFDAASWTGMCNTNCSARFKVISIFLCRRMHTIQQPPWVLQQHCHQSKIVGNPTPRCEGLFLWMEEILHHLGWLKPNK